MPNYITEPSHLFVPMLDRVERDVLKAYLCPAGYWTISRGLTAASGVVKPKKGMSITRHESMRLTMEAAQRNYAPRVRKYLPTPKQHVFDGGLLFDWNTGRIHNASWVGHWLAGRISAAHSSFMQWVNGGGRRLPGLVRRRQEEWDIIEHGRYPAGLQNEIGVFPIDIGLTKPDEYAERLVKLGFTDARHDPRLAVRQFQSKHNLKVDGLIGPATRATIKRAEDKLLANTATGVSGASGGVAGTGTGALANPEGATTEGLIWAAGLGLSMAAVCFLIFLAWRYRGPLFAWLPEPVKDYAQDHGIIIGRRVPA